MNVKPLLRNAAKLGLLTVGGVFGAIAVVWIRANSEWATIRLPSVMAPGSPGDVEYEARVYGIVAISFAAGLLSSAWIALTVWLRALRRERRLARILEKVEEQVEEHRQLHRGGAPSSSRALPPAAGAGDGDEEALGAFDELDEEDALLSDSPKLPAGYESADDEDSVDESEEDRG